MTGPSLPSYERLDHRPNSDSRVSGTRTLSAAGYLIHTTSGRASLSWLCGASADAGSPASANSLIDRTGTQHLITPDDRYAYHAGHSTVYLDARYNDDQVSQKLIGIELECLDTEQVTYQQYDSLADLMLWYAERYGFRWPLIYYGHYGVARPLGRRSDPVSLDWGTLTGRIYIRAAQLQLPGLT